jgi:hypothetical protein
MDCQVCYESSSDIYKVTCGSTVDHLICFDCEKQWREKMPIREGRRVMTCPTCRQPETNRTLGSLLREFAALGERIIDGIGTEPQETVPLARDEHRRTFVTPSPARPPGLPRVFCASGRECRSHGRDIRVKTYLKCRRCHLVACCNRCRTCTDCSL